MKLLLSVLAVLVVLHVVHSMPAQAERGTQEALGQLMKAYLQKNLNAESIQAYTKNDEIAAVANKKVGAGKVVGAIAAGAATGAIEAGVDEAMNG